MVAESRSAIDRTLYERDFALWLQTTARAIAGSEALL